MTSLPFDLIARSSTDALSGGKLRGSAGILPAVARASRPRSWRRRSRRDGGATRAVEYSGDSNPPLSAHRQHHPEPRPSAEHLVVSLGDFLQRIALNHWPHAGERTKPKR